MIVGVDINTKYLAVAHLSGGDFIEHWIIPAVETKRASALDRLYAINDGWRDWLGRQSWKSDEAGGVASDTYSEVKCVYVEDVPFVRNVKVCAQMNHVLAAVILGCHDAGVPVVLVGNTTWKKAVVGSGKADKAIIKDWAVKMLGVPLALPQDIYDAACVCHYGEIGAPK
jgi:hypothetical protein